jgi:tRNA (guanine-N(7)-)-methyltransferase subunit TRM82
LACSPYRFISAIHIPLDPAACDILISGGGDPVIKVWEWCAGTLLYDVAIEAAVRPFIAVRRAQPKRGYDSDGERKPPSRRWLARQRRKEVKAAAAAAKLSEDNINTVPEVEGAEAEVDVGNVDVEDDERTESDDETVDVSAAPAPASGDLEEPSPAPVLVVQKIESSNIDEQLVIVFSAVGCVSYREWLCLGLIYG